MLNLKKALLAISLLLMLPCTAGYATGEAGKPPEGDSATQKAADQTKEDDRLLIHKQDQWQFIVAPYLWVPGVNLKTGILNQTSTISLPWWNVIPMLFSSAIGGMGRFEVWKGKWGFFVDSYYVYVGSNVSDNAGKTIDLGRRQNVPVSLLLNGDLKFIVRAGNVDFGLRYLVGTINLDPDRPLPVLSCEMLAGGRIDIFSQYVKLNLDATLTGPLLTRTAGGSFVSKFDRVLIEPMLGIRLGLWLTPKAVITFKGTVGGFGFVADHNLDSDMELAFGYKVHQNIYAYVGYRARYESTSQSDLSLNGWIHGPILGTLFNF